MLTTEPNTDEQLDLFIAEFCQDSSSDKLFRLDYALHAVWLPEHPIVLLYAWYLLTKPPQPGNVSSPACEADITIAALVTDRALDAEFEATANVPVARAFRELAQAQHLPIIDFHHGLLLAPVTVAKPWGSEIWFSGMEQRGCSQVSDGCNSSPLPWVLSVAPERLCGQQAIALVKMLKPDADELLGNLYFELHKQKEEIYVVTRIKNQQKRNTASIRLGMNPERLRDYSSADHFRAAYATAVRDYANVRRQIDHWLDEKKDRAGFSSNAIIEPQLQRRWLNELDPTLATNERNARYRMHTFTNLLTLEEGDLVQVSRNLPHALQHGVEVLEFQSPLFERSILSFEQKVITQEFWDSDDAIKAMSLEDASGRIRRRRQLAANAVVARFDEVSVIRIELQPGQQFVLPAAEYGICFVLQGHLRQGCRVFNQGQAFLLGGMSLKAHLDGDAQPLQLTATGTAANHCYVALGNASE